MFTEKELKRNKSTEEILKDKKIEELILKANMYEKEIQRIKEERELQQQSMAALAIINRAKEDLKSLDAKRRIIALRLLEKVGTEEVIPVLTEALNDIDEAVKLRAGEIIIELGKSFKKKRNKSIFRKYSEDSLPHVLKKKKTARMKKEVSKAGSGVVSPEVAADAKPTEKGAN